MVCVEYCLFCDVCNRNWPDDGRNMRPAERRRKAKRDGWSQRGIDGERCDLCPGCEENYQWHKGERRGAPTFKQLLEMSRAR